MPRVKTLITILAISINSSPFALAQTPSETLQQASLTKFEASYFSSFEPSNAFEMMNLIPGFQIQTETDSDRGFGQASQNVVINGRRLSSKSSDITDALQRIPAQSVKLIHIVDGASLGIPGLSGQVANVITISSSITGSWSYNARFEKGTKPDLLDFGVSLKGTKKKVEYGVSIKNVSAILSEIGDEEHFDPSENLIETRDENTSFSSSSPTIGLNFTYKPKAQHIINLNLDSSWTNRNFQLIEDSQKPASNILFNSSVFQQGQDIESYEASADYAFPIKAGTLKLISINRHTITSGLSRLNDNVNTNTPSLTLFSTKDRETELIFRSQYSWIPKEKHDWQLSLEGAYNKLNSTNNFSINELSFPTDNVVVEEGRMEANVTHTRPISDDTNFQISLGAEYSDLNVTSQDSPARHFFRPKGFATLTHNLSSTYTLRTKLNRDVEQLDFKTFVSSESLETGNSDTGNTLIVPPQFLEGTIELERNDSKHLSGTIAAYAKKTYDPIDQILFLDSSQGPGNIDTEFSYGVEGNATILLDKYALNGVRVTISGKKNFSKVNDPITDVSRATNNSLKWSYLFSIDHNIPNSPWAWNAKIRQSKRALTYRVDQSLDFNFEKPIIDYGITHKDFFGMKLSMNIQNLPRWTIAQDRLIYQENRNQQLLRRQFVRQKRGAKLSISLSDTF